ncbi:MAG TPA: hypothetical protein VFO70_05250 [Chitinophagaceae bacterium]|nr:hypothetical protein [Chitinophagaceae bacterium]
MKILTLVFGLFPFFALSQDCPLTRQTDPYTKLKTISTGFIPLQGGSLTIDASKPEIDIFFTLNGSSLCFTDASTAVIYFAGSRTRLTQRNNGSMNCEGLFHFIFRNGATPPVLLRKMATQKLEKLIFTGNDKKETTLTFTPEQQQTILELSACIAKEAPGLLH